MLQAQSPGQVDAVRRIIGCIFLAVTEDIAAGFFKGLDRFIVAAGAAVIRAQFIKGCCEYGVVAAAADTMLGQCPAQEIFDFTVSPVSI